MIDFFGVKVDTVIVGYVVFLVVGLVVGFGVGYKFGAWRIEEKNRDIEKLNKECANKLQEMKQQREKREEREYQDYQKQLQILDRKMSGNFRWENMDFPIVNQGGNNPFSRYRVDAPLCPQKCRDGNGNPLTLQFTGNKQEISCPDCNFRQTLSFTIENMGTVMKEAQIEFERSRLFLENIRATGCLWNPIGSK